MMNLIGVSLSWPIPCEMTSVSPVNKYYLTSGDPVVKYQAPLRQGP